MPGSIHEVLAEDREPITAEQASTAVFYSISNCQNGLRGVSFGNFLIKQVASDLAETLPNLKTFVTLSPVPGFVNWVRDSRAKNSAPELNNAMTMAESIADGGPVDLSGAQRDQVMGLVAYYLSEAKRGDNLPVDPVSRFHLNNGASLERVHWMADASAKGLKQAAGIMVNYLYDLKGSKRTTKIMFETIRCQCLDLYAVCCPKRPAVSRHPILASLYWPSDKGL